MFIHVSLVGIKYFWLIDWRQRRWWWFDDDDDDDDDDAAAADDDDDDDVDDHESFKLVMRQPWLRRISDFIFLASVYMYESSWKSLL